MDVAFGVRNAYFDLVKQIDLLATAREAVRQFQQHLDVDVSARRMAPRCEAFVP